MKASGIGGQAVMEGIMMRNGDKYAIAVRKPDKSIETKKEEYKSATSKSGFFKLPIVRGVVAFVDSLFLGMSALTYSSELVEETDENYEPSKFEKFLIKIFKEKAADIVMGAVVVISILLAIGLFVLLPTFVANLLGGLINSSFKETLVEGGIRILLFILYVYLISLMKDIKRTYMYHGAEHKCINCIENGHKLTVENVREASRLHKRCGTSFLFIVMFISIIMFMFIRTDVLILKVALRLVLIPVVAGISYEFIKLAGSKESAILDILSFPGMLIQRITTREPDDDMIEVAIVAVEAVFDWEKFVAQVEKEEEIKAGTRYNLKADFDEDPENEDEPEEVSVQSEEEVIEEEDIVFETEINSEFTEFGDEFDTLLTSLDESTETEEASDEVVEDSHLEDEVLVVVEPVVKDVEVDQELENSMDIILEEVVEPVKEEVVPEKKDNKFISEIKNKLAQGLEIEDDEDDEEDEVFEEDEILGEMDEESEQEAFEEILTEEAPQNVQEEEIEEAFDEVLEEIPAEKTQEIQTEDSSESEQEILSGLFKELVDLEENKGNSSKAAVSVDSADDELEEKRPAKKEKVRFKKNKKKSSKEAAAERLARHRSISDYDEDFDESDELLRELDRIIEERQKENSENE